MRKEFNQYEWEGKWAEKFKDHLQKLPSIQNNLQMKKYEETFDSYLAEYCQMRNERKLKNTLHPEMQRFDALMGSAVKAYKEGK